MLENLTRRIIAAPKRVLGAAGILIVLLALFGLSAEKHMVDGGFEDPHSESSHANEVINEVFDRGGDPIVVKFDAPAGTDVTTDPTTRAVVDGVVKQLNDAGYFQHPTSIYNTPQRTELVSRDKTSTVVTAGVAGGDDLAPDRAADISEKLTGTRDGIDIKVGGQALVFSQVNDQTSKDLLIAETIAIPISFLLLIVIFGGLIAAGLPILLGIVSIIGTLAILRLLTMFTDVSIFAMNLTTVMGLALAIDYTLLILTRYREELEKTDNRSEAIVRTMNTAGRTVIFSGITVGLSMAALAVFPMYFLRSFAYAGVGVVIIAVLAAILLTPALLMVIGPRIDSLDVRRGFRKLFRRPEPQPKQLEQTVWYRCANWVLRHAVAVAVVVTAVLVVLGLPFAGLKLGFPDDRVLPVTATAHSVQNEIREQYDDSSSSMVTAVIEGDVKPEELSAYSANLSKVGEVAAVSSTAGIFANGQQVGPPITDMVKGNTSVLTVTTDVEPMEKSGQDQIAALRDVPRPDGATISFTGSAAANADTVGSIYHYLPWVLLIIAVSTYVLLFLFTGSVVLPLKALVMNLLSLSATFGLMVWVFQEGHLGGFGTTATGILVATMPVLMFCVAFGLSMDYEVFLLGRIREEWMKSDKTKADNDHAVAVGLARTGRVVTAAALLMAIVFAGVAASQVSFMRMFGVGLVVAVLMDATLIRMMLVPAFMRLAGRWNWWAPKPLRRLHDKIGLTEE